MMESWKSDDSIEGSAGKCGIVILHFEKLQKAPDTSHNAQEFMNTVHCSILSDSMLIHTSRVVIHTKYVNPVRSSLDRAVGAHTKSCH